MESELEEVVLEVFRTADNLGIKCVLVGALTSELSPEVGPDYPPFRRTNDADFAVHVPDWTSFNNLRARLIELRFTQHPKIEHRLLRGSVLVDLIPYGEGVAPRGKLHWPKSEFEMNVVGFKEVCAAANDQVKAGGPKVPVITTPGFVLLKIIAFLDRKARQEIKYQDDARDVLYWLTNYASGAADPRRFDAAAKMGGETVDYAAAGAALLGLEVGQLASQAAGEVVGEFLQGSEDLYSPFMDVTASRAFDEDTEKKARQATLDLLKAFARGYRRART